MIDLTTGTMSSALAHLEHWCDLAPQGVVCVEYISEFAREKVMDQLRPLLTEKEITLHELPLPFRQDALELLVDLRRQLVANEAEVVSVTGWGTAYSEEDGLYDFVRYINLHRERLCLLPVKQIWWFPEQFAREFQVGAPDFYSWFIFKIPLTEIPESPKPREEPSLTSSVSEIVVEEARRVAENLRNRVLTAQSRGRSKHESAELALRAIKILMDVSLWQEAEVLIEELLPPQEEWETLPPEEHVQSLNHLGDVFYYQKNYKDTLSLFEKSLALSETELGANHPDTATSLNNLATLYHAQGDYASALPLYERSLAIREKQLGAEHPDTATSLNNLAGLYESQGNYAQTLPLFERALAIYEKQLGENHPDTQITQKNYELLLEKMKK